MRRLSLAAAAAGLLALVAFGGSTAAGAAGPVDRQAWVQTGPVPTFVPADGRIYVAADVGSESARAFVHLDPATVEPGTALTFTEDGTASALADTAVVNACPLAGELQGSGELASAAAAPAADCTGSAAVRASRAVSGVWSVPLDSFLERWKSEPAFGIALVPALSQAATFHLSFDVAKTALTAGAVAPTRAATADAAPAAAPTTASDASPTPVAAPELGIPDLASPSPLSVATGAEAGISPIPPSQRLTTPKATSRSATPAAAFRPIDAASPPALLVLAIAGIGALGVARGWSRPRIRSGGDQRHIGTAITARTLVAAAAIVLLPTLFGEATVYKFGLVLIFIVGAIGLHLLVNWTGELSLAHAALVGLPAFVVVKLSADHGMSPIYLLPVGLLLGLVAGGVVGLPAIRARGLQVALVTLAAGVAIDRFFFTKDWIVGGVAGAQAAVPRLGPFTFATARSLYPVLGFLVVAAVAAAWAIYRSKVGRGFLWIKSHPEAASAFGIPVARYRVLAYMLAGAFAGFSGALTAMWVQRLTPQAFPLTKSFAYLIVVALAGRGFVGGVAAAAAFVEGGRLFLPNADALLTYGAPIGLIVTLTRYPAGINGAGRELLERIRRKEPSMDREIKGLNVRPLLGAGAVLLAIGFAAIGLAWYHAGNTSQVWIQNQELISGGVGGLALVVVGVGLLVYDRVLALRASDAERWERLIETLAKTPAPAPVPARRSRKSGVTSLVETRDVQLAFGGLQALGGVSLAVPKGSIVGLIGPNGAGKTTLFNSISGLQRIDSGQILFEDRDVTALPAHERAALGIGRSFQHLGLMMDETVETNVMAAQHLGAGYRGTDLLLRPGRWLARERNLKQRAAEALATFGLAGERARPVRDLSFAAARFVELAAVLVEAPELMLLDEPTTGLDVAEVATLLAALANVRDRGTTILVIAHDVSFVMDLCDHVYVLAEGRVLAEGAPADVQNNPAVVEAYLGVPA